MVRAVAGQVEAPDYRGCPFLNTHTEFPDPAHPAHQLAVRHRADLRGRLHALAVEAGARDPGVLADRLLLLIDGLYANGAVLGGQGAATAAVAFAQDVVDQATTTG